MYRVTALQALEGEKWQAIDYTKVHTSSGTESLPILYLFTVYSPDARVYSLPTQCLSTCHSLPVHCLYTLHTQSSRSVYIHTTHFCRYQPVYQDNLPFNVMLAIAQGQTWESVTWVRRQRIVRTDPTTNRDTRQWCGRGIRATIQTPGVNCPPMRRCQRVP